MQVCKDVHFSSVFYTCSRALFAFVYVPFSASSHTWVPVNKPAPTLGAFSIPLAAKIEHWPFYVAAKDEHNL